MKKYKSRLLQRATRQEWFELQQPQYNYFDFFINPKIIYPDIASEPRFAYDEESFFGATTIFIIPMKDLYLLGLLNSKIGALYFSNVCAALEGKNEKYLRFKRQYLLGFPVRIINFSDPIDVVHHDHLVTLVEQMLTLHNQSAAAKLPGEQERIQREIEMTDRQIDKLVYELYGLSEEEIKIVEGG